MKQEIKLYGTIGGEIKAADFVHKLSDLEQKGCKKLTIRLHSPGGMVFDGNVIYNSIYQSSIHIKIVIDGVAASMASIIILAADEVEICDNAFIMIHRPHAGTGGNADQIESDAKLLRDMETNFTQNYARKTGMTADEVKKRWFDGADHWLNADEAVQYGFATRKIEAIAKNIKQLKVSATMDANDLFKRFAASLNIKNQSNMKKELIETFSLENLSEESKDNEVLIALSAKFDSLEKQVNANIEANINALLDTAQKDQKISPMQRNTYFQIGKTSGITALSAVLSDLKPFGETTITGMLTKHNNAQAQTPEFKAKSKSEWTFEDYRMHAPQELRDNPKLFDELYRKQYGDNKDTV